MSFAKEGLSNEDLYPLAIEPFPGADFSSANLSLSKFHGTVLSDAGFSYADLSVADFPDADLSEARGLTNEQLRVVRRLEGAKLPDYLTEDTN